MKLRELLEKHTLSVEFAGYCDCGERKFDLITDDHLWYPLIHESSILKVKPELLAAEAEIKGIDGRYWAVATLVEGSVEEV